MAIDPAQLAAFSDPTVLEPSMPVKPDSMLEEESAVVESSPEEREQRLAHLVLVLNRVADDLQGFVDEIDADLLDDLTVELPPEEAETIQEAIKSLPREVTKAFLLAGDLSAEDAQFVADELAGREVVDNADRFAGWLQRASQVIHGTLPLEPDEEELETEEPDEEEYEEYEESTDEMDMEGGW